MWEASLLFARCRFVVYFAILVCFLIFCLMYPLVSYGGPRASRKRRLSFSSGNPPTTNPRATSAGKGFTYFKRPRSLGPARWSTPSAQPPYDRTCIRVRTVSSLSSSAGGTIGLTASASGCTGTTDWASYTATYDAFTVFGLKLTLFTARPGQDSLDATRGNLCTYIDMDSSAAVATVPLAFNYSSAKMHVGLSPSSCRITRNVWIPDNRRPKVNATASGFNATNDDCSIQVVGDTFGVSLLYYFYTIEWFIEFTNQR